MKPNATAPAPGEHLIVYAYPSSPRACRLKRGETGCYVVEAAGTEIPVPSYGEALERAMTLGTKPQRWSMDHPLNAHFL